MNPFQFLGLSFSFCKMRGRVGYIAKDLKISDIPRVKIKLKFLLYHLYLTLGKSLILFELSFSIYITGEAGLSCH